MTEAELMIEKWNRTWSVGQWVEFHNNYYKTETTAWLTVHGFPFITLKDYGNVFLASVKPVSLKAVESNYTHVTTGKWSIDRMIDSILACENSSVKYKIVRDDVVVPSEKKDPRVKFYIDGIELKGEVDFSFEPVHFSALGKEVCFSHCIKKGMGEKINQLMKTYHILYEAFDGKIPEDVLDLWYGKCLELT